jgi:hypothetical protein
MGVCTVWLLGTQNGTPWDPYWDINRIPNRRLDLAQVQAQIPAFLAEAHAEAEAQAQVQVPQVQVQVGEVGEVSDVNSNVNSAYSPVVVS